MFLKSIFTNQLCTFFSVTFSPCAFLSNKNAKFSRRRPIIRDDIGFVAYSVSGTSAEYTLTDTDLYVRCIITSNKENLLQNPFYPQYQTAWTQPFVNL